jgi:hypothetical protein
MHVFAALSIESLTFTDKLKGVIFIKGEFNKSNSTEDFENKHNLEI